MNHRSPFPIVLVGPTGGGKTRLAIDLARQLPGGGVCISADSMQVYAGMDIGTAKPTREERAAAPHLLLDIADPADDTFTVDRWLDLARAAVREALAAGRWPIIVGGTNLYVRAFLDGLFDGPPPDPALRSALADMSAAERRAELERVDPAAAARIHPNDVRRTIRALEVHRQTGRPISAFQAQWQPAAGDSINGDSAGANETPDPLLVLGLDYPVDAINRRINARVKQMMALGLLEEVRALHEAGRLGRQARAAVGYAQLIDHLEGRCTLEEAVEQIKIRTRRFAKQQRTWLRRFRHRPDSIFLSAAELEWDDLVEEALRAVATVAEQERAGES